MNTIRLIGARTDAGAGIRGASMGPEALRVADLAPALRKLGLTVDDSGDLNGPATVWRDPVDGFRHLAEVVEWNRLIYDTVAQTLREARLPMLLGGDHSLVIGAIAAVADHCRAADKKLLVLWLDAHADANTGDSTPSGNIHGMPVACLLGHGPRALTGLGAAMPILANGAIRQIGIRSVDHEEKKHLQKLGITVYDMRYIDEYGMRAAMQAALSDVDDNTHLHVSFDVDFLDPAMAPGVGTAVPGGPTYREAQLCMEMIADTGRLGSLDLMELNPACDTHNRTAELAVDLIGSLFGNSTLLR